MQKYSEVSTSQTIFGLYEILQIHFVSLNIYVAWIPNDFKQHIWNLNKHFKVIALSSKRITNMYAIKKRRSYVQAHDFDG